MIGCAIRISTSHTAGTRQATHECYSRSATSLGASQRRSCHQCWPGHRTRYCIIVRHDLLTRDCKPKIHHAMTPRLKTGQRLPYKPKLVRATTGKVIWKMAPGRAFKTMNGATTLYPIHTQIQACHHDRPRSIMEDTIIHLGIRAHQLLVQILNIAETYVLILKLSAIQLY